MTKAATCKEGAVTYSQGTGARRWANNALGDAGAQHIAVSVPTHTLSRGTNGLKVRSLELHPTPIANCRVTPHDIDPWSSTHLSATTM